MVAQRQEIVTVLTVDARDLQAKAAAVAADIDKIGAKLTTLAGAPAAVEQKLDASARATRRQASELENLLRSIDPVYAAHARLAGEQERVQRAMQGLDAQYRNGSRSAEAVTSATTMLTAKSKELADIQAQLSRGMLTGEQATARIATAMGGSVAAANRMTNALGLTRAQMAALTPQINDVVSGLIMGQSPMAIFSQQSGQIVQALQAGGAELPKFAAGMGMVVGGVAAAAAGMVAALVLHARYTSSIREMEQASTLMGGSLGMTAAGLDGLAHSAASAGGVSVTSARTMIAEYNKLGKIGPDTIQRLIGLTKDFAALTGEDAADAAKQLGTIMRDPAKGAAELADKFNLLSGSELDHIQRLAEMGQRTAAQSALTDALSGRIKGAADNTSYWSRKWADLKAGASDAMDAVGAKLDRFEKGAPRSDRINTLLDQLDQLRARAEEEATLGPADKSWKPGQSIGEAAQPSAANNDSLRLLAGDVYQQAAESAAEAWKALGDGVASANREASREADAVVRRYNEVDEAIRKATEDIATLNKGLGTDMSAAARQASEALVSALESRKAFMQNAQTQGLTPDTLKTQMINAETQNAAGMNPQARERYLAQRREEIALIDSTLPELEKEQRIRNAVGAVTASQAIAMADAIREMGLQADAADRMADAAGKGEAAQRRANIETQVAAAELRGLGLEARMYLEIQEEAARRQVHNEFARGIELEVAANQRLVDGMAKGVVAWREAEIYNAAYNQTLREASPAEEDFGLKLKANIALLEGKAKVLDSVAFGNYGKQLEDQTKQLDLQRKLIGANPEQSARLRAEADIDKLLRSQKTTYDALSETDKRRIDDLRAQTTQVYEMETAVQRQQGAWDEITRSLEKAFDRLGDALVDVFVSGKKNAIDWGGITKGIIASLMTDLIKMAAIRPLQNYLFNQSQPTLWDAFSGVSMPANQNGAQGGGMGGSLTNASQLVSNGVQIYNGGGGMIGGAANWFATSAMGQGLGLSTPAMAAQSAGVMAVPGGATAASVPQLTATGSSFTGAMGAIGAAAPYGFLGGMGGAYLSNQFMGGSKIGGGLAGAGLGLGSMALGTAAMGAMGMGAAASAAGLSGMAGASAALAAIPVWGWIAAAVIAAITAIAGSQKPSVGPLGGGNFKMEGGRALAGTYGADNGFDGEYSKQMADTAATAFQGFLDVTGAKVKADYSGQDSRLSYYAKDQDWKSLVNGVEKSFKSQDEAIIDMVRRTSDYYSSKSIITIEDANVKKAISNSKATKAEDFYKDIAAGRSWTDIAKLTAQGYNPFDEQIQQMTKAAEEAGAKFKETFIDLKDRIVSLGIATEKDALPRFREVFEAQIGLGKTFEPLRGVAAVLKQAEINVESFKPALASLGYTAAEQADLIKRYTKQMVDAYNEQIAGMTRNGRIAIEQAIDPNYRMSSVDLLRNLGIDQTGQDKIPALVSSFASFWDAAGKGSATVAGLRGAFERLNDQLRAGMISGDLYNNLIQTLTQAWQENAAAVGKMTQAVNDNLSIYARANNAVGRSYRGTMIGFDADMLSQLQSAAANGQDVGALAQVLQVERARAQIDAITSQIDKQISVLEQQTQAMEQERQARLNLSKTLKDQAASLLTDSSVSPLSPTDRLVEAEKQFRDALKLARGGDQTAAGRLNDLGRIAIEAERAVYASSRSDVFNEVRAGLLEISDAFDGSLPDGAVASIADTSRQQLNELKALKEQATNALNLNTASVDSLKTQLSGAIGNLTVAVGSMSPSVLGGDTSGNGLLKAIMRGQTQEKGYSGSTDLYGVNIDINRLVDISRAKGFSGTLGGGALTKWLEEDAARRSSIIQAAQLYNSLSASGLIGKIPGFAEGTQSAPSGWAWVGERGPELMNLRGGEAIMPHDMSMRFAAANDRWGGNVAEYRRPAAPSNSPDPEVRRQNELLEEQNRLLRQILASNAQGHIGTRQAIEDGNTYAADMATEARLRRSAPRTGTNG